MLRRRGSDSRNRVTSPVLDLGGFRLARGRRLVREPCRAVTHRIAVTPSSVRQGFDDACTDQTLNADHPARRNGEKFRSG